MAVLLTGTTLNKYLCRNTLQANFGPLMVPPLKRHNQEATFKVYYDFVIRASIHTKLWQKCSFEQVVPFSETKLACSVISVQRSQSMLLDFQATSLQQFVDMNLLPLNNNWQTHTVSISINYLNLIESE